MQFAHDKFNNVEGAIIPAHYLDILEKRAENSVKFKLYLHAVNQLKKPTTLASDEERLIK